MFLETDGKVISISAAPGDKMYKFELQKGEVFKFLSAISSELATKRKKYSKKPPLIAVFFSK
jgi:hypothetical protein